MYVETVFLDQTLLEDVSMTAIRFVEREEEDTTHFSTET